MKGLPLIAVRQRRIDADCPAFVARLERYRALRREFVDHF